MRTLQLYRSKKQFRWRFKGRNGRILANSGEAYRRRGEMIAALGVIFPALESSPEGILYSVAFRVQDDTGRKEAR